MIELINICQIHLELKDSQINYIYDSQQVTEILNLFQSNISKFEQFMSLVVNPVSIAQMIQNLDAVLIKDLMNLIKNSQDNKDFNSQQDTQKANNMQSDS